MDWDSVRSLIGRALTSLWGVTEYLEDAKEYHDRRSGASDADPDADRPVVRIPLFWGTF